MPLSTYISYRTKQSGYALPNLLCSLHFWMNRRNFEAKILDWVEFTKIVILLYLFFMIKPLILKFMRELMKDPVEAKLQLIQVKPSWYSKNLKLSHPNVQQ